MKLPIKDIHWDILLFVIALHASLMLAVATLFYWLWNTTMPQAFGLNTLTYWASFRLMFICWILFARNPGGRKDA